MRIFLIAAVCLLALPAYGQWHYDLSAMAYGGSGPTPFWLQANRSWAVPARLPAVSGQVALQRGYRPADSLHHRRFDWGAGLWLSLIHI